MAASQTHSGLFCPLVASSFPSGENVADLAMVKSMSRGLPKRATAPAGSGSAAPASAGAAGAGPRRLASDRPVAEGVNRCESRTPTTPMPNPTVRIDDGQPAHRRRRPGGQPIRSESRAGIGPRSAISRAERIACSRASAGSDRFVRAAPQPAAATAIPPRQPVAQQLAAAFQAALQHGQRDAKQPRRLVGMRPSR